MKFSRALLHVSIRSQFGTPAECQIGGLTEYEGGQGREKAAGARAVTGHLLQGGGAWSRKCQRRAKKGQSAG
jgi:hypothetical protein